MGEAAWNVELGFGLYRAQGQSLGGARWARDGWEGETEWREKKRSG